MGVSATCYSGPYIKAKIELKKTPYDVNACPKVECRNYRKDSSSVKFCDSCGSEITKQTRTKMSPTVDWWDLTEKMHEALSVRQNDSAPKDFNLYVPNHGRGQKRKHSFSPDYTDYFFLESVEPEAEIAWFKEMFADEIKAVEEAYGSDKVTIGWGIISYLS